MTYIDRNALRPWVLKSVAHTGVSSRDGMSTSAGDKDWLQVHGESGSEPGTWEGLIVWCVEPGHKGEFYDAGWPRAAWCHSVPVSSGQGTCLTGIL